MYSIDLWVHRCYHDDVKLIRWLSGSGISKPRYLRFLWWFLNHFSSIILFTIRIFMILSARKSLFLHTETGGSFGWCFLRSKPLRKYFSTWNLFNWRIIILWIIFLKDLKRPISFYKLDLTDSPSNFWCVSFEEYHFKPFQISLSVGFYIKILFWVRWFYSLSERMIRNILLIYTI